MDYIKFFEKLKKNDYRVEYKLVTESHKCVDVEMPEYYKKVNPINVEFEYNDGIIRLVPYEDLIPIRKAYSYIERGCIFATCNGEPLYVRDNKVFTCICGKNKIIEEEIATSVESFFEKINNVLN